MADSLKCLGKITAGRKPGAAGDFFNAVAGSCQKIFGSRNTDSCQIGDGGLSVKFRKLVGQIVFCNIAVVSKRVQCDFVPVIFLNIAFGLVAFMTAVLWLCKFAGYLFFAVYEQDKDSQIMLAYFFIALFFVMHLR